MFGGAYVLLLLLGTQLDRLSSATLNSLLSIWRSLGLWLSGNFK